MNVLSVSAARSLARISSLVQSRLCLRTPITLPMLGCEGAMTPLRDSTSGGGSIAPLYRRTIGL